MLDITVYPECLDCPFPDFRIDTSETYYVDQSLPITNQRLQCNRECTCKRILDSQIDFTPYVEEAKRRRREYGALRNERHETRILEVMKPNAKRKMVKAVCERCKQESDWHYSEKEAKRELENKECKL